VALDAHFGIRTGDGRADGSLRRLADRDPPNPGEDGGGGFETPALKSFNAGRLGLLLITLFIRTCSATDLPAGPFDGDRLVGLIAFFMAMLFMVGAGRAATLPMGR